jgi:chromate reductase
MTIFDLRDIPFYDGDVEAEGDPASVAALKAAVRQADAVIFTTPEYKYGTSGVLKNAVDWASRDREPGGLMGKPTTIMGAAGRAGTARSQMQLRETLAETGSIVMVKPGVLVFAFSPMKFDEDGNLTDPETQTLVERHMAEFAKWIIQVGNPREFPRFACEMDLTPTTS